MKQFTFLFLLLAARSFAQTGYPDSTFNYERREKFGDGFEFNMQYVYDLDFLGNGQTLYTGSFSDYGGWKINGLTRLNADRSIDKSFNPHFSNSCELHQSEVLPGGKIIVAGDFSSVAGASVNGIVRLNSDGTRDNSFLIGTGINSGGIVNSFLIDANNKIVIVGNFSSINGVSCNNIARLNADGTVDLTFNPVSGADGVIMAVREFADGRYAIGGSFTTYDGLSRNKLAVVLPDGTADTGFNISGGFSGEIYAIDIQDDQKILVTGWIYSYNSSVSLHSIARVNTDGTLDATFSNNNIFTGNPHWIEQRADGTILVAGSMGYHDADGFNAYGLMVTNADGSVTQLVETSALSSFYPDNFYIVKITISPSDEIYTLGYVDYTGIFSPYSGVLKFDGTTYQNIPQSSVEMGSDDALTDGLIQMDGKVICIGNFRQYDGENTSGIVRLNQDGTRDTTFISGSGIQNLTGNPVVGAVELQLDNRIIVAGNFDNYNGTPVHGPIRLNADGTLDVSFSSGTGVDGIVYDVAMQPDGKMILAGAFSYYNGNYCTGLCRVNVDGTYDVTFAPPAQLTYSSEIYTVEILQDGKIIIGGTFTDRLVRLNYDGSLDTQFSFPTASISSVKEVELMNDGKLLVLTTGAGLKKVNIDGSIDNSFGLSGIPGSSPPLKTITLRSDGTILIPGGILNADGSYQTGNLFSASTGYYNVNKIRVAYDGRIYFFGDHYIHPDFPMFNGIVRLVDTVPAVSGLQLYFTNIHDVTCSDSGSVQANAIFGQAPYSFEWLTIGSNDPHFVPGDHGFYGCTVVDNIGQRDTSYLYVDGPELLNEIDLRSSLHSNEFRPGFSGTFWVNAGNEGCLSTNGILSLELDTILDSVVTIPIPNSISGNTLYWNYSAINSDFGPVDIVVNYYVPQYAVIGDSITLNIQFSTVDPDVDTLNNGEEHEIPIVNGYDPNYVTVYPFGVCDELYVDSNRTLTYTVHFQNTGNSEALHIKVLDSLTGPLNTGSLKLLNSSSPVWVELMSNSTLMFHFDNIHLIDSTHDEPNSHGFVTYSLRSFPEEFGPVGNSADIFFDYNPAVSTNTVTNTIFNGTTTSDMCNLGIEELTPTENRMLVYPNPFNENVKIHFDHFEENTTYLVTDLSGKTVMTGILSENDETLQTHELTKGTYIVNFVSQKGYSLGNSKWIKL